jgi:uncharacterized membrane protein YkvA (DUF1232 family)
MDDENLPRQGRELAAGAIIYVVNPNDFVSDRNEAVASYVDDAILLRLALRDIVAKGADDAVDFKDRFAEIFERLEDELALCRGVMPDIMQWLEGKLDGLRVLDHKGRKAFKYLDDDEAREELFEDGLVFRTEYPVDDSNIRDRLKKASTVTDVMKRRRAEEARVGA